MKRLLLIILIALFSSCDSSDIEDAIDLAEGVPRKEIDTSRLGVNAFVNDPRFGSIPGQFTEVRDTLKLHFVRILFNWNDAVQRGPGAPLDLSFYDAIAAGIPANVDAIAVLTGAPSWMRNPANFINGNPRSTFVQSFVEPVIRRYAGNSRIIGFQIWNEPNMTSNQDNIVMEFATNPQNYVGLLTEAFNTARRIAPGKLVLNAATTSINQNYPESLIYNQMMVESGALNALDVYAVHYYGKQYENLIQDGGVEDFLDGLGKEVWVTESGAQGVNNQLAYGEEVWPFLREKVPAIARIYVYQFTEDTPANTTYGLKNLTPGFPISDLYVHLQNR